MESAPSEVNRDKAIILSYDVDRSDPEEVNSAIRDNGVGYVYYRTPLHIDLDGYSTRESLLVFLSQTGSDGRITHVMQVSVSESETQADVSDFSWLKPLLGPVGLAEFRTALCVFDVRELDDGHGLYPRDFIKCSDDRPPKKGGAPQGFYIVRLAEEVLSRLGL